MNFLWYCLFFNARAAGSDLDFMTDFMVLIDSAHSDSACQSVQDEWYSFLSDELGEILGSIE